LFMTAFLIFVRRMIRRGPEASPAQSEASGSLKYALQPRVSGDIASRRPAPEEQIP